MFLKFNTLWFLELCDFYKIQTLESLCIDNVYKFSKLTFILSTAHVNTNNFPYGFPLLLCEFFWLIHFHHENYPLKVHRFIFCLPLVIKTAILELPTSLNIEREKVKVALSVFCSDFLLPFIQTGSCYVDQADLKLLSLPNPPSSASPGGTIGVCN